MLLALAALEAEQGACADNEGFRTATIANEVRRLRGLVHTVKDAKAKEDAARWAAPGRASRAAAEADDAARRSHNLPPEERDALIEQATIANKIARLVVVLSAPTPKSNNFRFAASSGFASAAGIDRAIATLEARGMVARHGQRGIGITGLTPAGRGAAAALGAQRPRETAVGG